MKRQLLYCIVLYCIVLYCSCPTIQLAVKIILQLGAATERWQSYFLTALDLKNISYCCQELKQWSIQGGGGGAPRLQPPPQTTQNPKFKKRIL